MTRAATVPLVTGLLWQLLDSPVIEGDCLDVLRQLPDACVDAVVTDPPYGIGFMGHEWDQPGFGNRPRDAATGAGPRFGTPARSDNTTRSERGGAMRTGRHDRSTSVNQRFQACCESWAREALRVLKPGGHAVVFGSPRTFHRLTCGLEDAGFEIRDTLMWLFGSGFPKSIDVAKSIDKRRDDEADVRVVCRWLRGRIDESSETVRSIAERFGVHPRMVDHWAARDSDSQPTLPTLEQWCELRAFLALGDEMDAEVLRLNLRKGEPGEAWAKRPVTGVATEWRDRQNYALRSRDGLRRDMPHTPEARAWKGWGTALKPGYEPIVLARKSPHGTVVANVLEHGTGAINVDACRLAVASSTPGTTPPPSLVGGERQSVSGAIENGGSVGRWPANVVLSHTLDCVLVGERAVDSDGHFPTARGRGGVATCGHVGEQGLDERHMRGEIVEAWKCAPGCAVTMLDEHTGVLRAPTNQGGTPADGLGYGGSSATGRLLPPGRNDPGGASRFFYCAKASRAERDAGLDAAAHWMSTTSRRNEVARGAHSTIPWGNTHPTVKPIALMAWLLRLVTPPGGVVLDLFGGSGSTVCAGATEGITVVAIERDAQSVAIARARARWWSAHPEGIAPRMRGDAARRRHAAMAGQTDLFSEASNGS